MPAQFQDPESGSDTSQLTPFDSLLAQCRDLVCERLSLALAGMLDKAEETLTALANETRDVPSKKLYAQTRDKALAQREPIEKQFRTRYLREFQQRSNRVKRIGDSFAEIDLSSLELELIGKEDLDESLKFNAMAARLRQYCDEELIALDQRVGVLLGDASLQTEDNPFTPQAICDAYKHTCRQIDPNVDVRMVLLRLFDDHVADEIRAIYKAVNALLVQNSILPVIRLSAKKEAGKPAPSSRPAADLAKTTSPATEAPKANAPVAEAAKPILPAEPRAADGEQDLFSILKNLRAASMTAMPASGAGGAAGYGHGTGVVPGHGTGGIPGHAVAAGGAAGQSGSMPVGVNQTVLQGAELMGLLTRIQLGDATATPGNLLPMAHAGSGGMGMENVLRELKNTSVGTGMNQLDMLTLDIMSLVFDQLFDDPKVPVGVKGLIGRLQIPMLKVAIADKTFFSRKTHPARQLLDTLGDISLRLPADFNTSSPLFGNMEIILQELIDSFESNMDVFDVARKRVETLIAEEDQRVQKETQSAASRIEQNERLGLAKTVAQAEIKARVRTANVPIEVLEFLIEQWVQVLLVVHVVDGEDSETWKTALETMDLLIWSVEPKQTVDERRELAVIVPEVLQRISSGLRKVDIEDAVRKAFFADLMALHTGIIGKPDVEQKPPAQQVSAVTERAIADAGIPVGSAAVDSTAAALSQSPAPETVSEATTALPPLEQPASVPPAQMAATPAPHAEPVVAIQTAETAPPSAPDAVPEVTKEAATPQPAAEVSFDTPAAADVKPDSPLAAPTGTLPDLEFIPVPLIPAPSADVAAIPVAQSATMPGLDFAVPAATQAPEAAPESVSSATGKSAFVPDLEFILAPVANAAPTGQPTPLSLDIDLTDLTEGAAASGIALPPLPELNLVAQAISAQPEPTEPSALFAAPATSSGTAAVENAKAFTSSAPKPIDDALLSPGGQTSKPATSSAAAPGAQPAAKSPAAPVSPAAGPTGGPGVVLPSAAKPGFSPIAPANAAPSVKPMAATPANAAPSAKPMTVPATAASGLKPMAAPANTAPGVKPMTVPLSQTPRAPTASPTVPARPAPAAAPARPAVPQSPATAKPGAPPQRPQPMRPGATPAMKSAVAPAARPVSSAPSGAGTAARAGASAGRPPATPPSRDDSRLVDALDFTASITVQNPFGGGKVQVDDLDFTVKPAASAASTAAPKVEAVPAELPAKLNLGTWVGIRDKDDKTMRRSAKLSFISPLKTRYLFVDKQGKTTLDCSRGELARRFKLGEIVIMEKVPDVPLFDRITEGLVGKLGGTKPQR